MTDETIFPSLTRRSSILFDCVEMQPESAILHPTVASASVSASVSASEPRQQKYKNIILDMDGTLLDYIPVGFRENPNPRETTPIARPHLLEFMEFVFDRFERVSIWTAGTPAWFERCYTQILRHHIPDGRQFHFVKTRNPLEPYIVLKPLSEIYEKYPDEYNASNTLVVDDNPKTYRDNPDNAIGVKSFFYDLLPQTQRANLAETDIELLVAIEEIRCRLEGM